LSQLRTTPPPNIRPDRPLIPGHPPPSHLPLNPILYLTLAIDSIAPMIRMKQLKGLAGGGQSLPIPVPLNIRQRRRTAFMWIIDSASKKYHKMSGKGTFAHRLAQEIVSVVEGKSSLWERRLNTHRQAVAARSNVNSRKTSGNRR
jgi:small subunit ribosomal protein S7